MQSLQISLECFWEMYNAYKEWLDEYHLFLNWITKNKLLSDVLLPPINPPLNLLTIPIDCSVW